MIKVVTRGEFKKTDTFLRRMLKKDIMSILRRYGKEGVEALSKATPLDTGSTADSWYYTVSKKNGTYRLSWNNSNTTKKGVPIAILIQYGHSANGTWVEGKDFINPAILPVMNDLVAKLTEELNK